MAQDQTFTENRTQGGSRADLSSRIAKASVSPRTPVVAGSMTSWVISIVVGDYGFGHYSKIAVVRRSVCDTEVPQFDIPWASGFTTAETNGDALLALHFDPKVNLAPWRAGIVISLTEGMLKPGDTITLRLGDRRQGSPGIRAQTFPDSLHAFRVLADCMSMGRFLELEQETGVAIIPGPPCRAELIVPSSVRAGDAFEVKARVRDYWGNPVSSFTGRLSLLPTEGLAIEPHEPPGSAWPDGVAVIGRATAERPGVFYFRATGDFEAESNPVVASVEEPSRSLFWADMHGQTYSTCGTGSVLEFLSFARDSALVDVAAWQGNDFQVTPDGWREAKEGIKHFNEPGRFVTFLGYEHSPHRPRGGDHNVYFSGDQGRIFRSSIAQLQGLADPADERISTRDLVDEFRGRSDVMLIPHVGGRACDLDYFDSELMPALEICSHHGRFQWLAMEAMRRGHIVGFVGASDDHTGRLGLTSPTCLFPAWNTTFDLGGGYTGIYAESLTREAIWKAIKSRHCFATTGERIVLDVRMGDAIMGDMVHGIPPTLKVSIAGTAPLLDVALLRGTEVIHKPLPTESGTNEKPSYLVYWRGPTLGPTAGKVKWDGLISLSRGRIVGFKEFAFEKLGDEVRRISSDVIDIRSTTSGDIDGVAIELDAPADSELGFSTGALSFRLPVCQIDGSGKVYQSAEKDREVIVRKAPSAPPPRTVDFSFSDPTPAVGVNPYWIAVLQWNGHEAWSSPIYLKVP